MMDNRTMSMGDEDLDEFGTNIKPKSGEISVDPSCSVVEADDLMSSLRSLADIDDQNNKGQDIKFTQWTNSGPGVFTAIPPSFPKLVPGVYTVDSVRGKIMYHRKEINIDDLLQFPDSQSDKILTEITSFWKKGKVFKKYGFLHRRGYLLWGPQGSGKTCIVQMIVADIVRSGGIVFICDHPNMLELALSEFRTIERDRPVVCLFEDIDAIVNKYGEDVLLSLLDGETQINRVLNLATTNYPEKLDKRIVARPRRFDRRLKIGMPSDEVRRVYFQKKLKISDDEIDTWVKSTDKFSFASCAELVISVKCLGIDFDESISILRKLMGEKESSEDDRECIGFKSEKPGLMGLFADRPR
jgi:uncharacterized protein YehS (DUF1456 family)